MFETENHDLKYKLMWLVPNAQKNEMEPIMITLDPGGKYTEKNPMKVKNLATFYREQ